MSDSPIEHSNKKLKNGKHFIPITMISSNEKHDSNYFHKPPHHNNIKNNNDDGLNNSNSNSNSNNKYTSIIVSINKDSKETTQIEFTESEVNLFKILMDVVKESNCKSTLRVAGGWVRDKLRGDDSHDIDITLDNMMGESFAELVNKYLGNHHQETHRIGVIQSNPEQSKHLETATVKIFDMWIDFVNLRSETYTESSRIPEIKIGTPLDDSLRRDLTINSLFYNINENRIEDFTGNGIGDLKMGIIRTPLPPLTTFLDDPLRVFRSIRFATRLYFAIDQELIDAASNPVVSNAIKSKISHERIAKEFDGMLNGPRPDLSMYLIHHLGLYDCLFSLPPNFSDIPSDYQEKSVYYCYQMMRLINWGTINEENHQVSSTKRIRILASLMIPFGGKSFSSLVKKNRTITVIQYMLLDYLKLSNKDNDEVCLVLDCSNQFDPILKEYLVNKQSFNRKNVGLILHKCGPLWRVALLISLIKLLPTLNFNHSFPLHNNSKIDNHKPLNYQTHQHPHHQPFCSESKELIIEFDNFCATIENNNLIGVWKIKRLLDGKQVQELLKRPAGAWLAPVIQLILEWQLENPNLNEQDCKQWLLNTISISNK